MSGPVFDTLVPVARPFMPPLEQYCESLKGIWDRAYLSNGGPELQAFEKALAAVCGTKNLAVFSSGSLALEAALEMLETRGEVILPSFTFPATVNAVVRAGLVPVFADIEPNRLTIDPVEVDRLCNERTAAILGVHMFGMPCLVDELATIAARRNLPLIYDGAHAFALTYQGRSVASFGDASMFSLHATKALHSAEGGVLTVRDPERLQWVRDFASHGLGGIATRSTNAKMSEPVAALGRLVLSYLPELRRRLIALRACYDAAIADIPGVAPVCRPIDGLEGTSGFYPILINPAESGVSRDELGRKLLMQNIASRAYFSPLLNQDPRLDVPRNDTPVALDISRRIIALPFFADLEPADALRIADTVKGIISDRTG